MTFPACSSFTVASSNSVGRRGVGISPRARATSSRFRHPKIPGRGASLAWRLFLAAGGAESLALRVPGGKSGSQRAARVARGGLNPDALENSFAQEAAVGHAIERHAAGHAQIFFAGQFPRVSGQPQHDFLRHGLNGARQVHVALFDRLLRFARRAAEERVKASIGHGCAAQKIEIIQIHPKGTVLLQVEQFAKDRIRIDRLPVGRQAHQFVFAGIDAETAIIGEGGIKHAQRMGKTDFFEQFNFVAAGRGQSWWWPIRRRRRWSKWPPR